MIHMKISNDKLWVNYMAFSVRAMYPLSSPAAPTERKEVWGWGSIWGGARRRRNKARVYL
jgi:hypothetical protein